MMIFKRSKDQKCWRYQLMDLFMNNQMQVILYNVKFKK